MHNKEVPKTSKSSQQGSLENNMNAQQRGANDQQECTIKRFQRLTRTHSKEVPNINKNAQQKNTKDQHECIARKQQKALESHNKEMTKNNMSAQ